MPKGPRFLFVTDRKVEVSNRRLMAALTARHDYDVAMHAHRATMHLREALRWLDELDHAENRLLDAKVLTKQAEASAQDEQRQRTHLKQILRTAFQGLDEMRSTKMETLQQVEEKFDPFFTNPRSRVKREPRRKPRKRKSAMVPLAELAARMEEEEKERAAKLELAEKAAPPAPVPTPPPPPVAPAAAPKQPGPMKLVLDPKLVMKARRELMNRDKPQEKAGNELPAPLLGTSANGD